MDNDQTTANCQANGNHVVETMRSVEVVGKRPRGRVGIVRLHSSTTPRRVAIAVDEQVAVSVDDADHDCVIDETTQNSAVYLCEEHNPRRDFH